VEYLGAVVVVVALVLALVAAGLPGFVSDRFRCTFASVLGGGGNCSPGNGPTDKPLSDADYEPPLCTISTVTDKAGSKAKLGFFEWGTEYGFQDQLHQANYDVNGDGKVDGGDQLTYTTFTDSASIGATGGFGGKIGKLGKGSVDLGGGIKVNNGDTWVFKSKEEAESFRDDLEKLKTYETRRTSPGGAEASVGDGILALFGKGPLVEEDKLRDRIEDKLKDRHISYGSIGAYGNVDGGLSVNAGDDRVVSAGINGHAQISGDVVFTKDDYRGTKSYTYTVKGEGEWGSNASAGGFQKGTMRRPTAARPSRSLVTRRPGNWSGSTSPARPGPPLRHRGRPEHHRVHGEVRQRPVQGQREPPGAGLHHRPAQQRQRKLMRRPRSRRAAESPAGRGGDPGSDRGGRDGRPPTRVGPMTDERVGYGTECRGDVGSAGGAVARSGG
jgi:hypothetical protein